MPAALSSYGRKLVINALLRGLDFVAPSTVWLTLYHSDPGDADNPSAEVSVGAYQRVPITLSAPSDDGVCSNVAVITFPTATDNWGVITHAGIKDDQTSGHLLFHGPLDITETVNANDALEFRTGQIVCTLT